MVQIVANSVNYVNQCLVGKPDLDEGIILRNGASVEHVVCFIVHAYLDPVLAREWHHIPFLFLVPLYSPNAGEQFQIRSCLGKYL